VSRAAAFLLSPVVVPQALRLLRTTPPLTDPPGDRRGGVGDGLVRVVGDSTAVGAGVDALDDALPARLAERLRMRWELAGRSGWTAPQVRRDYAAEASAPADVLVLMVGWNDALRLRSPRAFAEALDALLGAATASTAVVVGPPAFEDYTAIPQPSRAAFGASADGIRRRSAAIAHAHGAVWVPGFDGAHVARDRFHPDAAGYDAMAEVIAQALGD
jgi:lysophospholipase L1-like esterase